MKYLSLCVHVPLCAEHAIKYLSFCVGLAPRARLTQQKNPTTHTPFAPFLPYAGHEAFLLGAA
jgi:hypothetical protein